MLETARLILCPPVQADFSAWSAFMADAEASRFIGGPQTPPLAWRGMATMAGSWTLKGYSMFSVLERQTGRWIGRIGPWQPEGWPGQDIGYVLVREAWGKGYAMEGTEAAIDWVLDNAGWSKFIHLINAENAASIALAKRLGSVKMAPGLVPPPFENEAVEIWGQMAQQWRERRQQRNPVF